MIALALISIRVDVHFQVPNQMQVQLQINQLVCACPSGGFEFVFSFQMSRLLEGQLVRCLPISNLLQTYLKQLFLFRVFAWSK